MDKTIFRYTRRQRGAMWGFALGLGVWAGAACVRSSRLLADHQTGGAAGLFLLLGLLPLVLFVVLVGMSTGITRIDAHGLRTRGMTGRKRVPWDRIESIDALGASAAEARSPESGSPAPTGDRSCCPSPSPREPSPWTPTSTTRSL